MAEQREACLSAEHREAEERKEGESPVERASKEEAESSVARRIAKQRDAAETREAKSRMAREQRDNEETDENPETQEEEEALDFNKTMESFDENKCKRTALRTMHRIQYEAARDETPHNTRAGSAARAASLQNPGARSASGSARVKTS